MQKLLTIQVPSGTNPNRSYAVTKSARTGAWYCECPSWKHQRTSPEARSCKHLKALALDLAVHVGDRAGVRV